MDASRHSGEETAATFSLNNSVCHHSLNDTLITRSPTPVLIFRFIMTSCPRDHCLNQWKTTSTLHHRKYIKLKKICAVKILTTREIFKNNKVKVVFGLNGSFIESYIIIHMMSYIIGLLLILLLYLPLTCAEVWSSIKLKLKYSSWVNELSYFPALYFNI